MAAHTRTLTVERSSVDAEAGTFEAVIFTGGEASDGHILDIPGGTIPREIPLFVNHYADPVSQLGTLRLVRKVGNEVVMRGEIMTEGEGAEADIRRDLLRKMAAGHVRSMSGRWDADEKDVQRRVNLPADHPAYVNDKATGAKRWGMYFRKWHALEGSIVGLGADKAAVMRWAEEAEQPAVQQFYRSFAEEPAAPDNASRLAAFAANVRELLDGGITAEELRAELPEEAESAENVIATEPEEVLTTRTNDPGMVAPEVAMSAAFPVIDTDAIAAQVADALDAMEQRVEAKLRAALDAARGKVKS